MGVAVGIKPPRGAASCMKHVPGLLAAREQLRDRTTGGSPHLHADYNHVHTRARPTCRCPGIGPPPKQAPPASVSLSRRHILLLTNPPLTVFDDRDVDGRGAESPRSAFSEAMAEKQRRQPTAASLPDTPQRDRRLVLDAPPARVSLNKSGPGPCSTAQPMSGIGR